eukprot:6683748-Ditylum_brightwellii.AAC.1
MHELDLIPRAHTLTEQHRMGSNSLQKIHKVMDTGATEVPIPIESKSSIKRHSLATKSDNAHLGT